VRELERAGRAQVDGEVKRLENGADATHVRAINAAAIEVYESLAMLALLPGGRFEEVLRFCLDKLDDAGAPDSGHRDIDYRMQRQMRMLANDLVQLDRTTYESWAKVESLLLNYDEQGLPLMVVRN
jgi:hypothetical protein